MVRTQQIGRILAGCAFFSLVSLHDAFPQSAGIQPSFDNPAVRIATVKANQILPVRGLYVQFERRGWPAEFWSGEAIQNFNDTDAVLGHTVSQEIALQLDTIRSLGVNTITFELRSADSVYLGGSFTPPDCNIPPVLGFQYPQPTATELTNLVSFFDLVQSKGIKVFLRLVNTHMEEQPPTKNTVWLGSILNAIKSHPALDLVLFEGNTHLVDTNGDGIGDACGIPAEPPLWLGPASVPAQYIRWAIAFAESLGISPGKLSAEAIVGDFFTMSEPPSGPDATNGHLWNPIRVLKMILDSLAIPNNQRTYAISFYEHRKCYNAQNLPCTDEDENAWAGETLANIFAVIGQGTGARVVAPEMGLLTTSDTAWTTVKALQSLMTLMGQYGVDGGSFWRWTNFQNSEDSDPTNPQPVKWRGTAFVYSPVRDVLKANYITGVRNEGRVGLPSSLSLGQNFPNPFNPTTTITLQLPLTTHVSLKVYDLLGREVATLVNEELTPGTYQQTFDAAGLGSGIYFYRLTAGNHSVTKKLVLLR